MEHTLIAGSTGSGKTNLLHIGIKEAVEGGFRLVLIDPKRIELTAWKNCRAVERLATTKEEIIKAMEFAVDIMERRYEAMERAGIRSLPDTAKRYLVIIDEVADLMITAKQEFLPLLTRLLNLGRGAKIFVVIATQSPSRLTIPAVVQLNCTARIALKCSAAIESRQVIGAVGAEKLKIGQALLKNKDFSEPKLLEIPLVTDDMIEEAVEFAELKPKTAYESGQEWESVKVYHENSRAEFDLRAKRIGNTLMIRAKGLPPGRRISDLTADKALVVIGDYGELIGRISVK